MRRRIEDEGSTILGCGLLAAIALTGCSGDDDLSPSASTAEEAVLKEIATKLDKYGHAKVTSVQKTDGALQGNGAYEVFYEATIEVLVCSMEARIAGIPTDALIWKDNPSKCTAQPGEVKANRSGLHYFGVGKELVATGKLLFQKRESGWVPFERSLSFTLNIPPTTR